MLLGYNTNGYAHHRLVDTIEILVEQGYRSVALTPDWSTLPPQDRGEVYEQIVRLVTHHHLSGVIESGARFFLDPRQKHQPTLLSATAAERRIRYDFLRECATLGHDLGWPTLSLWSGSPKSSKSSAELMALLVGQLRDLCDEVSAFGGRLAFEPEPGMFIDTMDKFADLFERVDRANFGLTLDVGHVVCQEEGLVSKHIHKWATRLWNIHIEDMLPKIHDHLFFGEGCVDFVDALGALLEISYSNGIHVELSRHSYDAVRVSQQSLEFLQRILDEVQASSKIPENEIPGEKS